MLDNGLDTRTTDVSALASAEKLPIQNPKNGRLNQVILPFHAPRA